jgi:hypothetical protein
MAHGGKREGAGKKKGSKASHTLQAQELKKKLIESFGAEADEIYKALITKAKTGDIPAIKEVLDRVWGKAPQQIDTPDIKDALAIIFDNEFARTPKEDSKK